MGDWEDEFPGVLWAYRTPVKTQIEESPFTLAYGCEAVPVVKQYFNKRVRPKTFKVGDLVLKKSGVTTQIEGKIGPKWKGPYLVIANNMPKLYRLKDSQDKELPHPWNAEQLRKFYQ
ncbi:hypothetical protein I3760_03G168400 [Carya illinoinensis]|nr:hypothetical protein I3760_03G168400 [Carya illinoinensis]